MTYIPYRGSIQAMTDIMAGRIAFGFFTVPTASGQVAGGKLRALAVSTKERTKLAPGLATMDEAGVKGFELATAYGSVGPGRHAAGDRQQAAAGDQGHRQHAGDPRQDRSRSATRSSAVRRRSSGTSSPIRSGSTARSSRRAACRNSNGHDLTRCRFASRIDRMSGRSVGCGPGARRARTARSDARQAAGANDASLSLQRQQARTGASGPGAGRHVGARPAAAAALSPAHRRPADRASGGIAAGDRGCRAQRKLSLPLKDVRSTARSPIPARWSRRR